MLLRNKYLLPIRQLFFPKICSCCGRELHENEKLICAFCMNDLPKTNFHLLMNNPLEDKMCRVAKIQNATSMYYYTKKSSVQMLIHEFKYKKKKSIGIFLSKLFAVQLKEYRWLNDIDLIIPLPLSEKKKQLRGFNQSEVIVSTLSESLNIPCNIDNFLRIKHTSTQTNKSNLERIENVANAFSVKDFSVFENKHLLLVDDIVTTGATMISATQELIQVKDCKISIAGLAITSDF